MPNSEIRALYRYLSDLNFDQFKTSFKEGGLLYDYFSEARYTGESLLDLALRRLDFFASLRIAGPWATLTDILKFSPSLEMTQLLIKKGADIHSVDEDGRNLLFFAKSIDIAKFLIEQGLDVNHRDYNDDTPIKFLIKGNHKSCRVAKFLEDLEDGI
jgi:ankyrin repeat protein